jgi:hypothetical protein
MGANSNEDRKGSDRAQTEHAKDETDRRFNETVRNLLNKPHKPHKDKGDGKPSPKPNREDAKASDRR